MSKLVLTIRKKGKETSINQFVWQTECYNLNSKLREQIKGAIFESFEEQSEQDSVLLKVMYELFDRLQNSGFSFHIKHPESGEIIGKVYAKYDSFGNFINLQLTLKEFQYDFWLHQ